MKLPTRSDTHRTDTLAVRQLLNAANADWLIRGLDERDYGVDLQMERFDGNTPTGDVVLVQVKGTATLPTPDKIPGFPVMTINYAMLFPVPFLVALVGLGGVTRFVWLQRYARKRLTEEQPDWKVQSTTTLTFREEDVLTDFSELVPTLELYQAEAAGFRFMRAVAELEELWDGQAADDVCHYTRLIQEIRNAKPRLQQFARANEWPTLQAIQGWFDVVADGRTPYDREIHDAQEEWGELRLIQRGLLLNSALEELDRFVVDAGIHE